VILGGGVALWLFTFVGASRGHVCDSTAFLSRIYSCEYSAYVNIRAQHARQRAAPRATACRVTCECGL